MEGERLVRKEKGGKEGWERKKRRGGAEEEKRIEEKIGNIEGNENRKW